MKKTIALILVGIGLLLLFPCRVFLHRTLYFSAQCIASFEGQDSLICKASGSSMVGLLCLGLSLIGLIIIILGITGHFRDISDKRTH